MHNKISDHQFHVWLLTAIVPAILSVAGRSGWLTILITSVVSSIVCFFALSFSQEDLPRWLRVIELAWMTAFLAGVARQSTTCWEDANGFPAIPIILLLLAAFTASRGEYRSVRIGATMAWLVLPILGVVFLVGTADVQWSWLRQELTIPDGSTTSLLLIPCVGIFVPGCSRKSLKWIPILSGLIAVAASALMDGTMGHVVAKLANNSFYEYCKGVNLFGVAERFEALVACALTVGWFVLYTVILSAVSYLSEDFSNSAAKCSVWCVSAASIGLMYILPNTDNWLTVGTLIFWGLLPAITQGLGRVKKLEKK